jgi:hypothetical protein
MKHFTFRLAAIALLTAGAFAATTAQAADPTPGNLPVPGCAACH